MYNLLIYSPLGRGFLSGEIRSEADFPAGDFRRSIPKFQGEQLEKNIALVEAIRQLAEEKALRPRSWRWPG